ncbi:MAG TPA: hypothetical protein VH518_21955 [Tepidisphaeraceae bacterium]|jgi:hypothetical protein
MSFRLFAARCAGVVSSLLVFTATVSAQLVVGTTTTAGPNAYYINVDALTATPLWQATTSGNKINGITVDPQNGLMYNADAARLSVRGYNAPLGTRPTFIAGMYRWDGNTTFSATGADDLAFAGGNVYCWTDFPSSTFTRGIYRVPTTPVNSRLVLEPLWLDTSSTYSFKGLAYNPGDGLFYGTNIADTTGTGGTLTPGLFSIDAFGTGAVTRIADFPAGRTEIDGIAIGGGSFWLTEKDRNSTNIYVYPFDPVSHTYDTTLALDIGDTKALSSGATWAPGAPEPACLGLLWLTASTLVRRRR